MEFAQQAQGHKSKNPINFQMSTESDDRVKELSALNFLLKVEKNDKCCVKREVVVI